ncbi:hypothetical protein EDD22DRAFT_741662, partial [Suillus occidentalis]
VRRLFKDAFNISQDDDFIAHEAPSQEDIYAYEHEDGPGPDLKNLAFDLKNGSKTPWNSKIIDLLLGELWRRGNTEGWPSRSEAYFREIIQDRYRRLRTVWKAAQPKITGKVKTLGDCGMSSEESDLENDIETVLRVKNMAWRRAIERELDIVDRQRLADDDIF